MDDNDGVWKGEFEWIIDGFRDTVFQSPIFKFGKYDCFLESSGIADYDIYDCYNIYLREVNYGFLNYKVFCKLSLIDGRGEEFLVSMRNTLNVNVEYQLMEIFDSDLEDKEYDLEPGNVLTLRLSWSEDENSFREWDNLALKRNLKLRTALSSLQNPSIDYVHESVSDLNLKKEPSKLLQKLSEDFGRFYERKEDTDFSLAVGGDLIPVHSYVLSARSKVFAKMFLQDISKDRNNVIEIPDVDAVVFRDVLYYVYSGQTRGLSADTMFSMHGVANKFHLIELKDACLDFIMRKLTVENVSDVAPLAYGHSDTKHWNNVIRFVRENHEDILDTKKGKKFLKSKTYFSRVMRKEIR